MLTRPAAARSRRAPWRPHSGSRGRPAGARPPRRRRLLPLPPYSPALNPVERVWLALRRAIGVFAEAVRARLDGLREHTAEIVRALTPERVALLTGYG